MTSESNNSMASHQYIYQLEDWPWVWAIRDRTVLVWQNDLDPQEIGRIARQQDLHHRQPLPLMEHLLIGSQLSVQNTETLQQMGVTHVLNMAGPACVVPIEEYQKAGIVYKRIDAQDEEDYPLLELHWDEASAFIRTARESGGKCVGHCGAGLNRSGLVVAAEMMVCPGTSTNSVLEVVRELRKVRGNWALMNDSFQEQLVALARESGRLGVSPGQDGSVVKAKPPPEERRVPEEEPNGLLLLCNG